MLISEIVGFKRPFGVRADVAGGLYVVDMKAGLLTRLNADFTRRWTFAGDPPMLGAHSVALALDGTILVTEFYGRRLRRISSDGRDLGILAAPCAAKPWLLSGPAGIEIFPDGAIVVADYGAHCLERFSPDGNFEAWNAGDGGWQSDGAPPGVASREGFDRVHAAVPLPDGRMLVADTWHHRLCFFNSQGHLDSILGGPVSGSALGDFDTPVAIALHSDGFVVSEYGNARLQYFGFDGCSRGWMGASQKSGPTVEWVTDSSLAEPSESLGGFRHPYDVKPYGTGFVVADTDNARIQLFSFVESN